MLSLILPVYKNEHLVDYCLTNIEQWVPTDAELIVVDDASGYETTQVIQRHPRVKLITHKENKGNTSAYNSGAKEAKGDILVFIDSDIILFDPSIEKFEGLFRQFKNVGVIGTLLLYPQNNTIQHAGVGFDKWVLSHIYTGRRAHEINFKPTEERQAVTAAYFACRKTLFNNIGGFNETYRDGLEDIDFCLMCKELGSKVIFSSKIKAFHLESATRGPYKNIRRTYNYSIFFSRWHNKFKQDLQFFLKKNISKEVLKKISRKKVIVINFCNTPNWLDLVESIKSRGVKFYSIHNLSGSINENDSIELYRKLPIIFQVSPIAILFLVDHFQQLQLNEAWFKQRSIRDIIIDRHANAILSDYWIQNEPFQ